MNIYSSTNYRQNLIDYWRQWYPEWEIPKGFHVHHIKPKSTFTNKNNPNIHHPKNLIALHPDDHASIHKHRGDKRVNDSFILSTVGRVDSFSTKQKKKTLMPKVVCRLSDRKEMSYALWCRCEKGYKPRSQITRTRDSQSKKGRPANNKGKIMSTRGKPKNKVVCRISDKREFSASHWAQYESRTKF